MAYVMYSVYGPQDCMADELPELVGLDEADVLAAIEIDGWCGCECDVEPVVVVLQDDSNTGDMSCLPIAAQDYLRQDRDIRVV